MPYSNINQYSILTAAPHNDEAEDKLKDWLKDYPHDYRVGTLQDSGKNLYVFADNNDTDPAGNVIARAKDSGIAFPHNIDLVLVGRMPNHNGQLCEFSDKTALTIKKGSVNDFEYKDGESAYTAFSNQCLEHVKKEDTPNNENDDLVDEEDELVDEEPAPAARTIPTQEQDEEELIDSAHGETTQETPENGTEEDVIPETDDYESDDPIRYEARSLVDELIPDSITDPDYRLNMTLDRPEDMEDLPDYYKTLVEGQFNHMEQSLSRTQAATRQNLRNVTPEELARIKQDLVDQIVEEAEQKVSQAFEQHFSARWQLRGINKYINDTLNELIQHEQTEQDKWIEKQLEQLLEEYERTHPSEVPALEQELTEKTAEQVNRLESKENETYELVTDNITALLGERGDITSGALSALVYLSAQHRDSQLSIDQMVHNFSISAQEERERRDKLNRDAKMAEEAARPVKIAAQYNEPEIEGEEPEKEETPGTSVPVGNPNNDEEPATENAETREEKDDDLEPYDPEEDDDDLEPYDPDEDEPANVVEHEDEDPDTDNEEDTEDKDTDTPYETIDDLEDLDGSGEDGGEEAHEKREKNEKKSKIAVGVGIGVLAAILIGATGWGWPGFFTGNDDDKSQETSNTAVQENGPDTDESGKYRLGDTLNVVNDGKVVHMRITRFVDGGGAVGVSDNGDEIAVPQDALDRNVDRHPEEFAGRDKTSEAPASSASSETESIAPPVNPNPVEESSDSSAEAAQ